jgi:competence protein ComEA
MRRALCVLIGVLAGFMLAGALVFVSRAPRGAPIELKPVPTKPPIAVDVIGAVPRPGLYEFSVGARVRDAIGAAGGMLAEADDNAVNHASLLVDGQQIDIPYKTGSQPASSSSLPNDLPSSGSDSTSDSATNSDLININPCTLEDLDSLPGIGPTTIQKILGYREANGPFSAIEDIMNVFGIGPTTFGDIKDLITT